MRLNNIAWFFVVCTGAHLGLAAATPPATQLSPTVVAPFDSDLGHLWNRLHSALLVRTAPDGQRVADDLFPYLWATTRYLLRPQAHYEALRVLDEFIETRGEKLIADPRKRLILQRELWAVFDWSVCAADGEGRPNTDEYTANSLRLFESAGMKAATTKADESAGIALRGRLATIIRRLALSDRELAGLGNNYQAAIQSRAFPTEYEPAERERRFFPADLMGPDSPWLCVNAEQSQHAHATGGRSAFLVFIQVPGGKRATEDFLNAYFFRTKVPAGTRLALLRQALAINQAGDVVPTKVTESLQVLVSRGRPLGDDPFDAYQFNLDRRAWFGGTHGLRALGPDDRSLWLFTRAHPDPFETPAKGPDDEMSDILISTPTPTLHNCGNCHQPQGGLSLSSLPSFCMAQSARDHARVAPTLPAAAMELAERNKTKRKDWEILRRLFTAEGARRGPSVPGAAHVAEPPATPPSPSRPTTNLLPGTPMQTLNTEFLRAVYRHELLSTRLADAKKDEHLIQSSIATNDRVVYGVEVKVTSFGKPFTATSESADGHVKETLTVTLTPTDDAKRMEAKFEHVVRQDDKVRLQFSGVTILVRWE